jgi:hypothetical protein
MSIEKSLYAAPQGIASEPIQVEIVDPEEVHVSGPGFEMHMEKEGTPEFDKNLAEDMDDGDLSSLAYDLIADVSKDEADRKEWLDTYIKGLKLLGLKYEERSEPWPGACGVFHPLLMEAAVKFQSETIMETFPTSGPVKTQIIGKETDEKVEASVRVRDDMNYQLTEIMQEYRPEHERMLLSLCLSGNAFKKVYFDPSLDRQTAVFISAEDVLVPYGAANLESAERVTHKMRKTKNELRKLQVAGFYRDIDLGDPIRVMDEVEKQKATEQGFNASADDRFQLLEMHVDLDLPGYEDPDGIKLPYVVTIEKSTATVLAVRRNWLEDDKLQLRRQHFVHYGYIPGFGFYYFGLIHLIGGHTHSATSLLRQLIDAGTLSNLPGGLKSKGLRIKGDDTPIAPGEFRDVDLGSGSIRDNILPLPYKEPSQVLMALMDKIVMDGRQFATAPDLKISDMSTQSPVGTTLAVLERAMKVISAVQARIHYTMKQEFKLLAAIIRDNTPEDYDYEPEVGNASAKRSDYDCVDIIPVSDPNSSTMAQRVVQYQAVLQLSQAAPQIYNLPFLHRQMIETLGVKNAGKIVPDKDDIKPMDPVSENMALLMSKPVKAFLYQDHEAHLAVHLAAMQDPKIMQVVGQNPGAQAIQGAAVAHIMEHTAFQYRKEIEKQLGVTLPPPPDFDGDDDEIGHLPPEIEVQLSQLASAAAARLLQKDVAEAQQAQAQQQAQDPMLQLQQMDLQIKKQLADLKGQELQLESQIKQQELQLKAQLDMAEAERKAKKDIADATSKADELEIKKAELQLMMQIEQAKLVTSTARDADKHDLNVARATTDSHHRHNDHLANLASRADDHLNKQRQMTADLQKHQNNLAQQANQQAMQQMHEGGMTSMKHEHEIHQAGVDRIHEAEEARIDRQHQVQLAKQNAKKGAKKESNE